ncbi:MAG: cupin, partial [Actinomycetota bacterium]|nr:cupin [Actinomycetota bacterium]
IHLTLGVHSWTRYALAEQLAEAALAKLCDDPEMRRTLPLGVDGPGPEIGTVRERLAAAVAEADSASMFHRTRRSQGRPAPLGPLAQLAAVDGLSPESLVRLRGALEARLEGSRLTTRVGWFDFPETELPSVARLLGGDVHTTADLGIELVEKLLRAGVLVPVEY